jgi:hypothetical protein
MSAKKTQNIPPIALTNTIANLLNCALGSLAGPIGYTQNQPFLIVTHIRASNKTAAAVNCTLYKGLTGASTAGTETCFSNAAVQPNDFIDWDGEMRLDAADFLTGLASANTAITLTVDAEIGIAG